MGGTIMANLNFEEERIYFTPILLYCDYINLQFNNYLKNNFEDITPRDFTYLVNIFYHQNISQKELSELLFVSESNVTQFIKRLEGKGLVYREINEENRSKRVLYLTQKGKITLVSVLNKISDWEKEFANNYSSDVFNNFKKILYEYSDKSINLD